MCHEKEPKTFPKRPVSDEEKARGGFWMVMAWIRGLVCSSSRIHSQNCQVVLFVPVVLEWKADNIRAVTLRIGLRDMLYYDRVTYR